jgi:hypothetical protein
MNRKESESKKRRRKRKELQKKVFEFEKAHQYSEGILIQAGTGRFILCSDEGIDGFDWVSSDQ